MWIYGTLGGKNTFSYFLLDALDCGENTPSLLLLFLLQFRASEAAYTIHLGIVLGENRSDVNSDI